MEPLTTVAIALGSVVATKALEKTGEMVGETLWNKTGELLVKLRKHSPNVVAAVEKAPEQPLDYGKAVLEIEAAAKSNPEIAQAVQEVATAAQAETNQNFIQLIQEIADTLKSQSQQPIFNNNQKFADEIKNFFQGNTFNAPVTFN
ncbi:hypothetical protein [Nostoc cycadae]|uniref:Uncharacterized protein n=1 Tax=Nostoc cycadae WK-1 TaxID=1861711 RepID=A0A2H6LEA8_9NOSO|nr:hypothetical protein [Nostoc cycadae]GBE91513.1 hypothetical protein NCWK1_1237 [Nostoc cycadae WK-1]